MNEAMINSVTKTLKLLEIQTASNMEVSSSEVKKVSNLFTNFIKNNDEIDTKIKEDLEKRINNLSSYVAQETSNKSFISMPASDVEKIKSTKLEKLALAGGVVVMITALGVGTYAYANRDKLIDAEAPAVEAEAPAAVVSEPIEEVAQAEVKKVLSESLAFDPNDNHELVNRMVDFIADSLTKGIPVKDVMTDEEIAQAEKEDQSLLTIAQLMDFYMVMNIEDIDPADYARLMYNSKTAETITDNYMYCARVFMTDSLTAKTSDEIDYTKVIAHKESAEQLQKFVDYLARYNENQVKAEELREYIMDQYIEKDANLYSMSTNEFVYRLMFDADLISNNSVLPKDMNIILNEDGKITCDTVKDDGVKNKTEKAEEFTSIFNTVDEKLEISREFANQDLANIDEYELKTGIELEEEIKASVLALNVRYVANAKFEFAKGVTVNASKGAAKGNSSYVTGVSPSTGKKVNVSTAELAKYGAKNLAEYEAAKRAEFEEKAKADPNHVIKNPEGKVVVSGSQVDTAQYNSGFAAGYSDGNKKLSSNPGSSNASYVAGYNEGYAKGLADRNALDAQYEKQKETTFEDVNDKVVEKKETIVEHPYTEEITPVQPEPTNPSEEPEVIFVPIEDGSNEKEETIEEIDYVSSLRNMRDILVASVSVDANKTMKM